MFKRGFTILMALFLALTWLSPVQTVLAASDTATFTFTASSSTSLYLVDTTFTLSATGTNATYPPFGPVKFYADGVEISDCSGVYLNYVNSTSSPTAGLPATCTTNDLSIGDHVITAVFTSYLPDLYDGATLTLDGGHTVSYTELTISPAALPDGQWAMGYRQVLTATGGDGTYEWSRSSDFPSTFNLANNEDGTAEIYGNTPTIGSFPTFTITVVDHAGGYGTIDYTLNITKATPDVYMSIIGADSLYADTAADIYVFASLDHPSSNGSIAYPEGTVSYLVDDVEVPTCSGDNVRTLSNGSTYCTYNTAGLAAGIHTVKAVYTPTDEYYTSASGETTFTVNPTRYAVTGKIFYDLDKDGVHDDTETAPSKGFKVNYDIDCNGEVDQYTWSGNNISGDGEYSITMLDAGSTFCMFLDQLLSGEVQTSQIGTEYTLDGDKYIEIGVYFPDLIYTPVELPYGTVNEYYSQTISISGGTAPYTITYDSENSYLPDGITFDPTTLTISGMPTIGSAGILSFDVVDAVGFEDSYTGNILIQTPGTYTLTSSANPSASGADVTFTYTGTGEAKMYFFGEFMTMPPIGMVDFYADGVAVDTCTGLYLNVDSSFNFGNYPATCTISSLADGTHTISVVYTDMMNGIFTGETDLSLTQVVGTTADTTAPVITPSVTGTLGSDSWYTSDVTLIWTVTDDESEITSQTGCDTVLITSDQAETTYICSATSEGGTASVDTTIKRDTTKPVTAITGVENGATYGLGSVPVAGCSTTDALSGVATEATLSLSGGDARGLGTITATCSGALDVAGNVADSARVTYTVLLPTDLKVTVTDSIDPVKAKGSLIYTMVVTNLGPNTAKNIKVTDTLDPMTSFIVLAMPKGWSCKLQSNVITCTAASLAAGKKATFIIATVVSKNAIPGNRLVNTASVSSQMYDTKLSNNSYTQTTLIAKTHR